MTSSFPNSDKVWYFLISVSLVFIAFLSLTYCVYRRRGSHSFNFFRRLGQASLFSLVIGFLKEGLDALSDDWFWCVRDTCDFHGWDIAIYIDGVVLGALVIICIKMCTLPAVEEDPACERTVASSIDGDDEDEENANANATRNNNAKNGFSNDEIPAEIMLNDESSNADASAGTKKSTSTGDLTTTSDSSTGVESDSYALDDDEEQQISSV
jgi:hypothetical protein